jgi:Restriction endonuclease
MNSTLYPPPNDLELTITPGQKIWTIIGPTPGSPPHVVPNPLTDQDFLRQVRDLRRYSGMKFSPGEKLDIRIFEDVARELSARITPLLLSEEARQAVRVRLNQVQLGRARLTIRVADRGPTGDQILALPWEVVAPDPNEFPVRQSTLELVREWMVTDPDDVPATDGLTDWPVRHFAVNSAPEKDSVLSYERRNSRLPEALTPLSDAATAALHRAGFPEVIGYFGPPRESAAKRTEDIIVRCLDRGDTALQAAHRARASLVDIVEHQGQPFIFPLAWTQLAVYQRRLEHREPSILLPLPHRIELANISDLLVPKLRLNYDLIYQIGPDAFELLVMELMQTMGFHVERPTTTFQSDGGIDFVFRPSRQEPIPLLGAAQVTFHKTGKRKEGPASLRELAGVLSGKFNLGLLVTNTEFTEKSRLFAEEKSPMLRLRDGEDLKCWLQNDFNLQDPLRDFPAKINLTSDLWIRFK